MYLFVCKLLSAQTLGINPTWAFQAIGLEIAEWFLDIKDISWVESMEICMSQFVMLNKQSNLYTISSTWDP